MRSSDDDLDRAILLRPLESWTDRGLDESSRGERPADFQECPSQGTRDCFAKGVKEEVCRNGKRASDCLFP